MSCPVHLKTHYGVTVMARHPHLALEDACTCHVAVEKKDEFWRRYDTTSDDFLLKKEQFAEKALIWCREKKSPHNQLGKTLVPRAWVVEFIEETYKDDADLVKKALDVVKKLEITDEWKYGRKLIKFMVRVDVYDVGDALFGEEPAE